MNNTFSQKPSVSVVIPFYNRSHFILDCLDSINKQSYQAKEIIIVDDCSKAEESEQLKQISLNNKCKNQPPINIITLPQNAGVSYARNIGVANAAGELIAFLDSDDYWNESKLDKQVGYMCKHPDCVAVHTGTLVFNSDGEIARHVDKPEQLRISDLIKSSHVTPPSLLIKKKVFLQINGFDTKFRQTEDYEFSMRLIINGFQVHCINEPLTYVRRGDHEKLSSSTWGYFVGHMNVVLKYRREYFENEGWFALNKYTAKYLYGVAKRIGGLGNIYALLAFIIYPPKAFKR